jgi:hypothetical protein
MAKNIDITITEDFLKDNPNAYFVFGDNTFRRGYGGGASLRDHPRSYGFITKKFPDNRDSSFYDCEEYREVFPKELQNLKTFINENCEYTFYISQLGGGLANRYHIWETIVKKQLEEEFQNYDNVVFLWEK